MTSTIEELRALLSSFDPDESWDVEASIIRAKLPAMLDRMEALERVAAKVAEMSPHVDWDGMTPKNGFARCLLCGEESDGPNPFSNQPTTNGTDAPESIAEWDAYRKQCDERSAYLVGAILHEPDCAWVEAVTLGEKAAT